MRPDPEATTLPLSLDRLLADSVREILRHRDAERFFGWFRDHFRDYCTAARDGRCLEPEVLATLAAALGRAIWNSTPLPENDYRPAPLPAPAADQPCPCGSTRRYGECCAEMPPPPGLDPELMWGAVLVQIPPREAGRLIASGCVPLAVLLPLAQDHLEAKRPAKAARLLEPLFTHPQNWSAGGYEEALNILYDAYEDLEWERKAEALLQRVIAEGSKSPLRSAAWQRLAAVRMDQGQAAAAWEAFRNAQKDDPDAPTLAVLEIQLLMEESQPAQAQARAKFWLRRLERQGCPADAAGLEFLRDVAHDPVTAFTELMFELAEGAGTRLAEWIASVEGRPVPVYHITEEPPAFAAEASFDEDVDWWDLLQAYSANDGDVCSPVGAAVEPACQAALGALEDRVRGGSIQPPPGIAELEAGWHGVFPLGKPVTIYPLGFGEVDAWDPDEEEDWMDFLEDHPEAFDSLDVIDDLLSAVFQHRQYGTQWLGRSLETPLLRRAEAILAPTLRRAPDAGIPWKYAGNRPALRCLMRLVCHRLRAGETETAYAIAQRLLEINPPDEPGVRALLASHWLREGKDADLLALVASYPDDTLPELAYGQVLALYRLGRLAEAREALGRAQAQLPEVLRCLLQARARGARTAPSECEENALVYRKETRDLWVATPGALEWLRHAAREGTPRSGRRKPSARS
jgi:tetratricopeptide (TPR) repeat protein